MEGIILPICALFFSSLLCIIYFLKKRVNILENKIYSIMVIICLIDSVIESLLQLMALGGVNSQEIFFINLLNKIAFPCLIIFSTCLFLYAFIISYPKIIKKLKNLLFPCIVIDCISFLAILILPIKIINEGIKFSVSGLAVNLTYLICGLFIAGSVIISLVNIKKNDKRYIPILSIILIVAVLFLLFKINPYLIIISITLTYVSFIMFHTIENPDIKLIEELYKSNEMVEKSNKDKSVLLFNMTQRIRYPLNIIEQRLEQISYENLNDDIGSKLNDIKNSTKTIANVLNNVLDISTIDTKKIKIVDKQYNLQKLLKEICLRFEQELKEKNLEFRINFDSALPNFLMGDSLRLKQIIVALLSNSLKFTEKGFVELNVNSIISFDICRLIIKIKDSGVGMDVDKITALFKKSNDINYNAFDNNALSLDAAQKMVNLIGGTITVQSDKEKGSEFTIIVDQKIINDKMVTSKKYEELLNKPTILFVNDNSEETAVYKKILENIGKVFYVDSGEECLTKIRNKESFDLIIIKNKMDKLDGVHTLLKLKELLYFENNVILLTDEKDNIKISTYKGLGFKEIISTNITKEMFKNIIMNIMTESNHIVDL